MHSAFFKFLTVISISILSLMFDVHKAMAITIYSTFGEPGQTHKLESWGLGIDSGFALPFTANDTYRLDEVDLAAFAFLGPTPITLSIVEGDLQAGNVLESFEIVLPTAPWVPQVHRAYSVLHPLLLAGTNYWFVTKADERIKSIVALNFNDQNGIGDWYYWYNNEWNAYSGSLIAFGVYGSTSSAAPVPEPDTILLFAAGLALLVFIRVNRTSYIVSTIER